MATTPHYSLPYPEADDPNNVPEDMQALATAVEAKMAGMVTGTVRPAAGVLGRYWFNTATKVLQFDTGAAWVDVAGTPPLAFIVSRTGSSQTIPHSTTTETKVTGFTVTGGLNDSGIFNVGTSRFTCPVGGAGRWNFQAVIDWPGAQIQPHYVEFRRNGSQSRPVMADPTGGALSTQGLIQNGSRILTMAEGDYLELFVRQESGDPQPVQVQEFSGEWKRA